jgi:hypothetical protein
MSSNNGEEGKNNSNGNIDKYSKIFDQHDAPLLVKIFFFSHQTTKLFLFCQEKSYNDLMMEAPSISLERPLLKTLI